MDEKSLFDHDKNDPLTRPRGTDVRDSDHSEVHTSKRNSINHRIREMSSDRMIHTPKGSGHDQLASSSLRTETMPLPRSERETSLIEMEEIDQIDEPIQMQTMTGPGPGDKKKIKPSIIDRAREMEKGRV
jgi:hypothetical protein